MINIQNPTTSAKNGSIQMANQIQGVKKRLLDCAVKEFLQKGYANASLHRISEAARTSTTSIYVRFGDKAGLFSAIVDGACEDFIQMCKAEIERFNRTNAGMPVEEMMTYKMDMMDQILDIIFYHFEAFRLLSSRARFYKAGNFNGLSHDFECAVLLFISNSLYEKNNIPYNVIN